KFISVVGASGSFLKGYQGYYCGIKQNSGRRRRRGSATRRKKVGVLLFPSWFLVLDHSFLSPLALRAQN
ncbi:hypothetical protein Ancab_030784, partial [Ancistrocladus abbreviatus]